MTRVLPTFGVALALLGLVGCIAEPSTGAPLPTRDRPAALQPSASIPPTASASTPVTFVSVVDGDTVETSAGTVRVIGIDTPERGECGYDEASVAVGGLLAPGDPVTLELPAGENDTDKYGRLVRYVVTGAGIDLGLMQLEAGNAVARYDSTDGYPAHPREAAYRAAQLASLSADGHVVTTGCAQTDPAAPPSRTPSAGDRWWTAYTSCSKLKRNSVGDPTGPFRRDDPAQAEIYDWFADGTGNHGDGDGDGLACEG